MLHKFVRNQKMPIQYVKNEDGEVSYEPTLAINSASRKWAKLWMVDDTRKVDEAIQSMTSLRALVLDGGTSIPLHSHLEAGKPHCKSCSLERNLMRRSIHNSRGNAAGSPSPTRARRPNRADLKSRTLSHIAATRQLERAMDQPQGKSAPQVNT